MSGTLPTSPAPAKIRLTSNQASALSIAKSGRRQSRVLGGHLFELDLDYGILSRAQFGPILGFLIGQAGKDEIFQVGLTYFAEPLGVGTGTPLISVATSAATNTIPTKGWTPSTNGIIKAGSFMKFAGHTKVYMVTQDANSDVSGLANITVYPKIIEDLALDEGVVINDVEFTMSLNSDDFEFDTTVPGKHRFRLRLIEAIT